jgi:hypothetical protein
VRGGGRQAVAPNVGDERRVRILCGFLFHLEGIFLKVKDVSFDRVPYVFSFREKSALAPKLRGPQSSCQQVRRRVSGIALYSPRRAAAREAPPKRWCSVSLTAAGAYRVRATPRGRCARAPRSASGPARKALPRRVVARCRARARRSAPRATGRRADPPRASEPCFRGTRCRPSPRSAPRRARGRRLRRVARASMRASSPFRVFALRCFIRGLRRRASRPR